jgi:hypothetical protein
MKFNLFQVYPAIWNSTNLDGEEMRRKSREVALASASRDNSTTSFSALYFWSLGLIIIGILWLLP